MFFFVITKNLKLEILTKDLVTFKRWDGVKDEKFEYCRGWLKNLIFWGGGSCQKNQYIGANSLRDNGQVVKVLDSQSRGLCSKPLGGSKIDSAFHPSEVGKMNTRNTWELSGKKQTASLKWL